MDAWEETTGQPRRRENESPEEWSNQPGKPSLSSSLEMEIADLEAKLAPPSLEQIMGELSRCLRLTVPVGMTNEDRREWLLVAVPEVQSIPSCEFFDACAEARKKADHPAKIVPAIHAFKAWSFASASWYREQLSRLKAQNNGAKRIEDTRGQYEPDEALKQGMASLVAELRQKERDAARGMQLRENPRSGVEAEGLQPGPQDAS